MRRAPPYLPAMRLLYLHYGPQSGVTPSVARALTAAGVPHSPITPIEGVADLPFVAETALRTATPDGRTVRLPPPAVMTDHLERSGRTMPFAPGYGEQTDALLAEIRIPGEEIAALRRRGVVA